jgi:hypothetical protein
MTLQTLSVSYALSASFLISKLKGLGPTSRLDNFAKPLPTSQELPPMSDAIPHGIRLNNPGNLRAMILPNSGVNLDEHFANFFTIEDGLANLLALLRHYYNDLHLTTTPKIIARYAPASENDIDQYASLVTRFIGANPLHVATTDLFLNDDWRALAYMRAIIRVENGAPPVAWATGSEWFSLQHAAVAFDKWREWNAKK